MDDKGALIMRLKTFFILSTQRKQNMYKTLLLNNKQ